MLIVNVIGLGLIGLIIWWFWLYKPKAMQIKEAVSDNEITIVVEDGVYQPANISLNENSAIRLRFIRKDASPCASTVLFPDLDVSAELPLDKPFIVTLPTMKKGEYSFHCQMKMNNGSIVVK